MKQRATLLFALLMLLFCCRVTSGQLLQIGPGYVKAPFVRVHAYADGSSFVRAPFVSVHANGRLHHSVPHPAPHEMSWDGLCTFALQAVDELDAQLRGFPTGAYWQNYLVTQELRDFVHGHPVTLSEQTRRRLTEIRDIYATIQTIPELSAITRLTGFQSVQVALHELLLTPEQRLRRDLCSASAHLIDAASRLKESSHWQDFLTLGFTPDGPPPALERVERVQRRYDSLHEDDVIARLPGFQETHELIRHYLQERRGPMAAEELPPAEPSPDSEGE